MNRRTFLTAPWCTAATPLIAQQPGTIDAPAPRDWSGQMPRPLSGSRHRRARSTASAATSSATRRSSGCTPARCGPKARPGTASAGIWSGATSRTTSDALDRRRRPRHRVPQSVRLQQRQHVRLRRPAALLRARRPARRPLRAERHGHRDRRQVPGQAPELAERHRRPSRRQHLVHRSDLRHPRQLRRLQGRIGNQAGGLPRRCRRADRSTRSPTRSTSPNGLCFSPDYKKVYIADTGTGREITSLRRRRQASRNGKRFVQLDIPGSGSRRPPTASAATSTATLGGRAARRAGHRAERRDASA